MANQLYAAPFVAQDANGNPVSGARLKFFISGTATQVVVYSDSALTTAHDTDGIESDASGVFAQAFYGGSNALKADATASGASLPGFPRDPILQVADTSSGARSLSFTPVTGNTNTNVQDAIAANSASINAFGTQGATGQDLFEAATPAAARTVLALGTVATADLIDEDTMATDSATRPPSQQSVKAYVDGIAPVVKIVAGGVLDGTGTPAWTWRAGFSAAVTDNSTGDYTVAFSTAQPDTNYGVLISVIGADGVTGRYFPRYAAIATSGFDVVITDTTGTPADISSISVQVFRAI